MIPESARVVVLDKDLSVRQAFHAMFEQVIDSAPLWDSQGKTIDGTICATDFIHAILQLKENVEKGKCALTAVILNSIEI